jgi:hypothetical protein
MAQGMIMRRGGAGAAATGLPEFTYTGTYQLLDDGDKNWRIKFLTSGTFTPSKTVTIDLFLAGGGAGTSAGGGGAGSGYTTTYYGIVCQAGAGYPITIGAGGAIASRGGTSSAFSVSAVGGYSNNGGHGGNGGSGGGEAAQSVGGSDGGNGVPAGGTGQGTTTREFGEDTGTLYAGGGSAYNATVGGAGGGGAGKTSGEPNTGGGAGGVGSGSGYTGGSGIVIIRNKR